MYPFGASDPLPQKGVLGYDPVFYGYEASPAFYAHRGLPYGINDAPQTPPGYGTPVNPVPGRPTHDPLNAVGSMPPDAGLRGAGGNAPTGPASSPAPTATGLTNAMGQFSRYAEEEGPPRRSPPRRPGRPGGYPAPQMGRTVPRRQAQAWQLPPQSPPPRVLLDPRGGYAGLEEGPEQFARYAGHLPYSDDDDDGDTVAGMNLPPEQPGQGPAGQIPAGGMPMMMGPMIPPEVLPDLMMALLMLADLTSAVSAQGGVPPAGYNGPGCF